jgi:hydroxyacylglutathione hydrolase
MTFQYTDLRSKLSIIMSEEGDLFCSDLLTNVGRFTINNVTEGKTVARSSVEKSEELKIKQGYTGYGKPLYISPLQ